MSDTDATDLDEVVDNPPANDDAEAQADAKELDDGDVPSDDDADEAGDADDEADDAGEVEFDLGGGQKVSFKADATAAEIFEEAQKTFKDAEGNLTRRNQETAELRKTLEANQQAVQKLADLQGDALQTFSHGQRLKAELDELAQIDLEALWQSDSTQARRVSDAISQRQAQFQQTISKVAEQEQAFQNEQQAVDARRSTEGEAQIRRQVKNFDAEAVVDYAVKTYGIPETEAKTWRLNPAAAVMAHKAMLYDQMQAKAVKAAKQPAKANPVKAAKGRGGTAPKDLVRDADKMSGDEWLRQRQQQLKKAGRR